MQFHLSLNVSDIGRSVAFYEQVFGQPAAKQRADYAKFEVAEPPLVLSLEPMAPGGRGSLNHVGLRLDDAAALVELQRRLEMAGLTSQREEGVECCYAKQTKFWLHDPDGVLWEFYVLEGDIAHRGAGQAAEQVAAATASSTPPVTRATQTEAARNETWEHQLGQPLSVTAAAQSLAEVRLRGTFNSAEAEPHRDTFLAAVRQALRPGGRLALHLLTADRPLAQPPSLPGPAAYVTAVPVDTDLLASLERAGFADLRLTKFGATPCFKAAGAEMRETMIEGFAPQPTTAEATVLVVYRGPFRELSDDAGRVFRRGERVRLPAGDWQRIAASPAAEGFAKLDEPGRVVLNCGGEPAAAVASSAGIED